MSKKLLLSLTIMAGVLFVGASPALATTPPLLCKGAGAPAANVRQYNTGVTLGRSIVVQAWRSTDQEPDSFEEFYATVRPIILGKIAELPDNASDAIKCRAKGLSQGVCDGFGVVQDEVGAVCLLDGQTWGNLSGDLYCALAIEFGGAELFDLLPVPPTNLCGTNFVSGCVGEFEDFAYELAACEPYTDEPVTSGPAKQFVDEYLSWQGGLCSYEIP
jgi:hypothetical protein